LQTNQAEENLKKVRTDNLQINMFNIFTMGHAGKPTDRGKTERGVYASHRKIQTKMTI